MSLKHPVRLYRSLGLLFGLLILISATPARAQLGLGLVPMRVELRLAPGQQYSGSLKLSNESGGKTRIRSEILDFYIDETDTPQFERDIPREAPFSCKKWLSLNPMEMEIEKGGFVSVRYTLRLPAELAEGSYNCAAGFTTLPPAEQAGGIGMRVAVRAVAAVYVQVGSPSVRGLLKRINLESTPPAKDSKEETWQAVVVLEKQRTDVLPAFWQTRNVGHFRQDHRDRRIPLASRLARTGPTVHFPAQNQTRTGALLTACPRRHRHGRDSGRFGGGDRRGSRGPAPESIG